MKSDPKMKVEPAVIQEIMGKISSMNNIQNQEVPFKEGSPFFLRVHEGEEYCQLFNASFDCFVNKPPIFSEGIATIF